MPTIHDILTAPDELHEILGALDKARCLVVLFLRYEPAMLEEVLECYDNLYTLRRALETCKPSENGNKRN